MELKCPFVKRKGNTSCCLNRTFYGIEILPESCPTSVRSCLNRTFYGIEIAQELHQDHLILVLIVPFMELK